MTTVKDIFEMRKQGKTEEAYAAIRELYRVHQGHYTTIAMFWTAMDIFHMRIKEGRTQEAYKIFLSLKRLFPTLHDDPDHKAWTAVMRAALDVSKRISTFSMIRFVQEWGISKLSADDWRARQANGHIVPSLAQRILGSVFHDLERAPSLDHALLVAPLLQEAVNHRADNRNIRRYMAVVYGIMGERQKARDLYVQLLQRSHETYLYSELAALVDNADVQLSLLCLAVTHQRDEKFSIKIRLRLATILLHNNPAQAAYELQKCTAIRQQCGYHDTREIIDLRRHLQGIAPVSDVAAQSFYRQQVAKMQWDKV